MKYKNILQEANRINDQQFLKNIENSDPNSFEFSVIETGSYFTLKEISTNIIIFKTEDEDYADKTCDELNRNKDAGKDALINAIKTLYMGNGGM